MAVVGVQVRSKREGSDDLLSPVAFLNALIVVVEFQLD